MTMSHSLGAPPSAKLVMLGFQAEGAAPLFIGAEHEAILVRLSESTNGHALSVVLQDNVAVEDLPGLLQTHKPRALHLSCHGDMNGYLELRDLTGFRLFEPEALVRLLKGANESLKLIVLNACFSARLADALAQEGFVVIGTNDRVPSERAATFSGVFYGLLAEGNTVRAALDKAQSATMLGERHLGGLYKLRTPHGTQAEDLVMVATPNNAQTTSLPPPPPRPTVLPHQIVLHLDAYDGGHSVEEVEALLDPHRKDRKVFRLSDQMRRLGVARLVHGQEVLDWDGLAEATQSFMDEALASTADDGVPVDYVISGVAPHPTFAHVGYVLSSWRGRRQIVIHRDHRDGSVVQFTLGEGPAVTGPHFFAPNVKKLGVDVCSRSDGSVGLYLGALGGPLPTTVEGYFKEHNVALAEVVELVHSRPDEKNPGRVTPLCSDDGPRVSNELILAGTSLANSYPNHSGVTLFVNGPGFLGFLAGRALNPRQQRAQSIALTFYKHPRYVPAYTLPLAENRAPHVPQDDGAKLRRREVFDAIKRGIAALQRSITRDDLRVPKGLLVGQPAVADKLLRELTRLELGERPQGEVFELSSGRREMKLGDGLLHALHSLSDPELERFGRLLTLHELIHPRQGLFGTNYQGVGRAGFVLEDIDFWADAFSIHSATAWEARDQGARGERELDRLLAENIRVHLLAMAAFDRMEQGDTLARLPERRLRRYLLWSLQRARAEQVHTPAALDEMFEHRLVVELAPLAGRLDARGDKLVGHEHSDPQLFVALGGALLRKPKLAESFVPARLVGLTRELKLDPLRDHLRAVVEEHAAVLTAWGDS
jgi:hypothetical protein